MRISDWSSDVCSSDLGPRTRGDDRPGVARSGCACERAAQMGSGACRRSGPCLSRSRPDEAGADGDRSPAARAGQAEGGARHPKKSRRLLRSEEHTSELQSLMRISYAVFCLKKKKNNTIRNTT